MDADYSALFTGTVLIFLLAAILLITLNRFKLPSIIGFLLTGMILGPSGLGLVKNEAAINFFAELGIIFLLFTIGLEFSFSSMLKSRRYVLIGGTVQVGMTILVCMAGLMLLGLDMAHALFGGMLISLSSTAIVMKVLTDRGEIESLQGRAILGILIFQDLIVIPMMILTPMLGGESAGMPSVIKLVGGSIGIIALVFISSKYLMPLLLQHAVRLRNREMFIFIIFGTCLLVAFLTSQIGLSMALGAFLAGLIISESEYGMHAMYNIIPFRDIFSSFFFITIGMIFDFNYLLTHPVLVVVGVVVLICIKYLTGTAAALLSGLPSGPSVFTGLALSQVGEFSFILATTGSTIGLLTTEMFQLFLNVAIVSMGVAPILISLSGVVTPHLSRPIRRIVSSRREEVSEEREEMMHDHLIIVGFGINGRNVAKSARIAGVHYEIIEMNPDVIRQERLKGESIMYGDAVQPDVLLHAGIERARILVVVINDPFATQQIVKVSRELSPDIYIIARTRFVSEVQSLQDIGADEVIPEEFETSVEIFSRILNKYLIPSEKIEEMVREIRSHGYQMLRTSTSTSPTLADLRVLVPEIDLKNIALGTASPYRGMMLRETELRKKFGVSVVAIRRGCDVIINPGGEEVILDGDILMVLGRPDDIALAFHRKESESEKIIENGEMGMDCHGKMVV